MHRPTLAGFGVGRVDQVDNVARRAVEDVGHADVVARFADFQQKPFGVGLVFAPRDGLP